MDDDVLAALTGVLEVLWRIQVEWPDKPCSLAKLSKQAERPMSVLRRQLNALVEAGWVELVLDEGGVTGTVKLSAEGLRLAREIFA
jgi:DNA-binding IclR family transcriptional regulator